MTVRTINEQEQLAIKSCNPGDSYVAILLTKGEKWTWYFVKSFLSRKEAENWFNEVEPESARVYKVRKKTASIEMAR